MKWLLVKLNKMAGIKAISEKEFENIQKYRAVKGQLKKVIDDHNELVGLVAISLSSKGLKNAIECKGIQTKNLTREELEETFKELYQQTFKKSH